MFVLSYCHKRTVAIWICRWIYAPRYDKTYILHKQNQRRRSAARFQRICLHLQKVATKQITQPIRHFKSLAILCGFTVRFVWDLDCNPKTGFLKTWLIYKEVVCPSLLSFSHLSFMQADCSQSKIKGTGAVLDTSS